MNQHINNTPLKKFSLFSLTIGAVVGIIGLIFFGALGMYTNNPWWFVAFVAFFGYPAMGLIAIAALSYIGHLFYKGSVPKAIRIFGLVICILIALLPAITIPVQYITQKSLEIENQSRWAQENTPEKLRAEQERLADENMKANCALYEKSIRAWKDGEPKPLKPIGCP